MINRTLAYLLLLLVGVVRLSCTPAEAQEEFQLGRIYRGSGVQAVQAQNIQPQSVATQDATSGDTALSIKSNTYFALDGTAVGASAPTRGVRYNAVAGSVDFLSGFW